VRIRFGEARSGFCIGAASQPGSDRSARECVLQWLAERTPRWVTSDQLTALGLGAQVGAGICYAVARSERLALLGVIAFIVLNWLGDSLDGTLARARQQQRLAMDSMSTTW